MDRSLGRRGFLARCATAAGGLCALDPLPHSDQLPRPALGQGLFDFAPAEDGEREVSDAPADYWDSLSGDRAVCRLCPRECRVADQERGTCGVRMNVGGKYRTLVHSRVCAAHIDPVEKKPFFHVLPGAKAFSIATAGCNIQCRYCQNWEISQFRPEQIPSVEVPPARVIETARGSSCPFVAFTYSEPVVFWEYVRDVADAGNARGVRSLVISNGYIQEKPLRDLLPRLSGVKIDLKGFTESFYRDVCDGELKPVLRTLEILKETGIWFEIVVLVVPTLNDDEGSMRGLCEWVARTLGPEVPLHFTRFHPMYRLQNLPSTPIGTLERIHGYAREAGLHFAYVGNAPGHPAESTYCPGCGKTLIKRVGYTIMETALKGGSCSSCGRAIPGLWT
ncbi:MAG: AmmeMemoRadiSam system radical SAM enzyme [Candidatus Eisenbacteria bacterium]|nr:AmmeMemoRadiSam system radical SAM enzyme [Candidatus Eisenbacteria bacterium]